jgi:DNA polymerase-3 subunit epsilon
MSPCLNDLDPNLYRRKLDEALALFGGSGDGGAALLAHIDRQMRAAAAEERFERAAWLRRRRERIAALVRALDGNLQATHTRPRLVLAPHPRDARRCDAFWLHEGRVVDWGPPTPPTPADSIDGDPYERTRRAVARRADTVAHLPATEVAEARIVQTWLAGHEAPALDLDPLPERAVLEAFLSR